MGGEIRLDSEERTFFGLIDRAAFTNPFGREREAVDLELAGLESAESDAERIEKALEAVFFRMEKFEAEGKADIRKYAGRDRVLVRNGLLYHFFHVFLKRFDSFILEQAKAGDVCLRVPFAKEAFRWMVRRGFEEGEVRRYFELAFQLRRAYFFINANLAGCSPCMKELRRKLWNNVFTQDLDLYNRYLFDKMEDFSTMLLGETGTGKGTAAAAIGRSGYIPFDEDKGCFEESFTRAFVSINLSRFSENLIESELFGHRKGAFTGAVENYEGVLDRCSPWGSIFLDEIGEVSPPVQIKLLEVLQEREFNPVGSHERRRFQGRVIAATNRPLTELRGRGRMREDFFYRLCSDIVTVPPLRERIREDPRELDVLLSLIATRLLGSPFPEIVGMVRQVVVEQLGMDYPWPGNVRELGQCVRRALMNKSCDGFSGGVSNDLEKRIVEGIQNGDIGAQELVAGYCRLLYERRGTYEAVARATGLDRRTVKKHIESQAFPTTCLPCAESTMDS